MKRVVSFILIVTVLAACLPAFAASSYEELITSVLETLNENNKSVSGAPQQTANGAYRAVEMLAIMAYRLDSTGTYSELISDMIDTLNANNRNLDSAPQQTANGMYRIVEMLAGWAETL